MPRRAATRPVRVLGEKGDDRQAPRDDVASSPSASPASGLRLRDGAQVRWRLDS